MEQIKMVRLDFAKSVFLLVDVQRCLNILQEWKSPKPNCKIYRHQMINGLDLLSGSRHPFMMLWMDLS